MNSETRSEDANPLLQKTFLLDTFPPKNDNNTIIEQYIHGH